MATLHHSDPALWEFEMHNEMENRLTSEFLTRCLEKALQIVEDDWITQQPSSKVERNGKGKFAPGALIISGRWDQEKFFSNGGDFGVAQEDNSFFINIFNPPIAHLLRFTIPTIAAINGHAFGAGFILALACDYRVMQTSRGWCCLNEVLFGAPMPFPFSAVLNLKVANQKFIREIGLEAKRYDAKELLELELVDVITKDGPETLAVSRELAAQYAPMAETGVWGQIKSETARSALTLLSTPFATLLPSHDARAFNSRL